MCIRPGWGTATTVGPHTLSLQTSCHGAAVPPGAPCFGEVPGGVQPQGDPHALLVVGLHCSGTLGVQTLSCVDRWHDSAQLRGQWPSQAQNSDSTGSIPFSTLRCFRSFCWTSRWRVYHWDIITLDERNGILSIPSWLPSWNRRQEKYSRKYRAL